MKQKNLFAHIKQNYRSFLLGLFSFVILAILIVKLVPSLPLPTIPSNSLPTPTPTSKNETEQNKKEIIHKVQPGESLWIIAENYYNSGFRAFDIANANNIPDPDSIEEGQTLKIPVLDDTQGEITPEAASTSRINEKGSNQTQYTVKSGDYLWRIAENVYGNGYLWEKIARANNLANPGLIHSGNVLTIPI